MPTDKNTTVPTDLTAQKNLLKEIGEKLRDAQLSIADLKACLMEYQDLMQNLLNFDERNEAHTNNLSFNNGVAISTSYAARCLRDYHRTKAFVSGLFHAIEQLKQEGKKSVHIFYAGTGPFATLVLPIFANYPASFIQCTLMEINQTSFDYVQDVMKKLDFQAYIKEYILDDATTYQFNGEPEVNILVSETMSNGLQDEQQVPILMNLVPQLKKPFILIPENISLTLAYMKNLILHPVTAESKESDYCQRLKLLLETNQEGINALSKAQKETGAGWQFPELTLQISEADIQDYHNLVVLTDIQVFQEDRIELTQSDLTLPVSLLEFHGLQQAQEFTIRYKVDEQPGFIFSWKNAEA